MAVLAVAQGMKNLNLQPWVYNTGSTASWKVSKGNHVLVLAKNVATSENTAAGAALKGIAGTKFSDLTQLGWNLIDGTQGGGAPRWNIYYGPHGGDMRGYMFVRPAIGSSGIQTFAPTDGFIVGDAPEPGDEIMGMDVIVDEQGSWTLDDFKFVVNGKTITIGGPGNSN